MAIDIRSDITCSLGTVISGNVGDDYIQGSGLIKTQGSVLISGLITPDIGTVVTFEYTKSGITRSIPRKLRVMSSFADPYRRTTQVELGCKLTYLSDLQDKIDWNAFDDPENSDRTEEEARIVTIPIRASSLMNKCLQELGITASNNPLTNRFSIATFSFDSGYVSILSDLLVSESYCGYLDVNEVLQVFSLDPPTGTGPVFSADDIIDLGPIGVGQLPGEAVTVSYSTLKLKDPDPEPAENATQEEQEEYNNNIDRINWERSETVDSLQYYYINIKRSENVMLTIVYTGISATTTETFYRDIFYQDADGKQVRKEVPSTRTTTTYGPAIAELASVATAYFQEGTGGFNNAQLILSLKEDEFLYDSFGNEIKLESTTYKPKATILAATQFDWVYNGQNFVESYILIPSEYTVQEKEFSGNYSRTTTSQYVKWALTQQGEQAVSMTNQFTGVDTLADAITVSLDILGGGLVHNKTTETTERSGATTSQERPPAAERTNAAYADGGDPSNGWRTESQAELELAVGSATAQRRIEFSLPYAPDDTFRSIGGRYLAFPSDAPEKATRYGRVQNRLLLGSRNGISLQLAPRKLLKEPFAPFYVEANGLTAMYRANGTSWTFDGNGIVASVDALFWAAVGGTGDFWFPVAPGITTLPSSPTVIDTSPTQVIGTVATVGSTPQTTLNTAFPTAVDGDGVQDETTEDFWVYDGTTWTNVGPTPGPTTTPIAVVLPYNETSIYNGILRTRLSVVKLDYSLQLLTEVPSLAVRTKITISRVIIAESAVYTLSGQAATFSTNSVLNTVTGSFLLAGQDAELVQMGPPTLVAAAATFTLTGQDAVLQAPLRILTGTQAPLLGAGGATDSTGWTILQDYDNYDEAVTVSGWPFNFTLNSSNRTSCLVWPNAYITFDSIGTITTYSASVPNVRKIFFGVDLDNTSQRVYRKFDTASDGSSVVRIRYEGTAGFDGVIGSPTIVVELSFHQPRVGSSDQWVEVRVGNHNRTGGLFMIASQSTNYASNTIAANTSWVFVGNGTGTSWTLTSNRYVG